MISEERIIIYADGACEPNPGSGGYGIVIISNDGIDELCGGFRFTTNNRMELYSAIRALEHIKSPSHITIFSDSQYLVKGMQSWIKEWTKKKRLGGGKKTMKNSDLWNRLLKLCEIHQVEFIWIRGHAGHRENERSDELSFIGLETSDPERDEVYESLIRDKIGA